MAISIAERLKPFSHLPGTSTILPGSFYQIQIFPCLIRVYECKKTVPLLVTEVELKIKGPVEQFTICNDLEKGRITVSGLTPDGWIRYHLTSDKQGKNICLFVDRAPLLSLSILHQHICYQLVQKETLFLLKQSSVFEPYQPPSCDRLSLGNHKAQDWEMIMRRLELNEILPLWHRLGQLIPPISYSSPVEGSLTLLEDCKNSVFEQRPEKTQSLWLNCIRSSFISLLTPQLEDSLYQGLTPNALLTSFENSPLGLLVEGSRLIRQLFVQQMDHQIIILPHLLPCLWSGRLINLRLNNGLSLSMEWTKKTIRRLEIYVEQEQNIVFKFRSHVRSYRIRQNMKDKGIRKECHTSIFLNKNCHYFFDNFQ